MISSEKQFSAEDALKNAQEIFASRYAGAEFCFAAGSIILGHGTILSDLDLVVIFPKLEQAYRESFIYNEMPIEVFVHDYETIQAFMDEDYKDAHISIIHMIASGEVVPSGTKTALQLKDYASKLIEKGPEPLTSEKLAMARYSIGDLIDDLRGNRPREEQRAILYTLYPKLGDLALRQKGQFIPSGKHLPRSLKINCPDLFQNLENVMHAAHHEGLRPEHIQQLQNILDSLGGQIFDGYKLNAPPGKRAKPAWSP